MIPRIIAYYCLLFAFTAHAQEPFASKLKFSQNQPVIFEKFTIIYIDKRENGFYPNTTRRLAPFLDFRLETGGKTITLSYSAGTGDIGPVFFAAGDDCFKLELDMAEGIGRLADDEMVVTPAAEGCKTP